MTILAAPVLSLFAVGVHYEALVFASAFVNRVAGTARVGVALAVVLALAARILAVSEAVTGLVLIAWTASYTFFEMRSHWETQRVG